MSRYAIQVDEDVGVDIRKASKETMIPVKSITEACLNHWLRGGKVKNLPDRKKKR